MQDLHTCQGPVHEDERLAFLHVALQLVGHDAAQWVEALTHVGRIGIQVERIRFAQAEHGCQRNKVTIWRSWSSVMSLVTRTTTPLGYSISHNALADALLAEYTEDLPDIFTGMKLPQEAGWGSAFILDLQ